MRGSLAFIVAALAAVMLAAAAVSEASAAKPIAGPDKPGWSVSVREADPSFTDLIHLDFEAPADETRVWGYVRCWQGDLLVYAQFNGLGPWYYAGDDAPFSLGPTQRWTAGSAECVAQVGDAPRGEFRSRASVSFTAAA